MFWQNTLLIPKEVYHEKEKNSNSIHLYRECLYRIEFGLLANLLLHTGKSEKRKDASSEADHWLS
jgi:hypothetical protein